jgi:UDP-N-acetylmuramyl pentapeptide phosphotransferase/UDP-N-acetylglucosamine-1-phosphate transferase
MRSVVIFGAAFLLSAVLVRVIRDWAEGKAILDHPNERSSHDVPKPRGGGIAIVAITLAGSAWWWTPRFAIVAAAALVIAVVSWIDDVRHLPATLRLGVQSLAAIAVLIAYPVGALAPLAFLWIVGLTNAYNFMDGIDGIAGGQAIVAGLAWALFGMLAQQPLIAMLGLLIAGSSAGFLMENWQPARIFMGDVGSAFLGFTFAALAVMAWPNLRLAAAGVLTVWPFVVDAGFTFVRRALRGERVMEAHRSHVYQRLNQRGLSHGTVSLIYIGLAAIGAGAAIVILR